MKFLRKVALAVPAFLFGEAGASVAGSVLMFAIIGGGVAIAAGYAPQIQQEYRDVADFIARVFVAVGGPP